MSGPVSVHPLHVSSHRIQRQVASSWKYSPGQKSSQDPSNRYELGLQLWQSDDSVPLQLRHCW